MTEKQECYIIEKNGKYFQCISTYPFQRRFVWSENKYDAARITDHQWAWRSAKKMKARLMVFNPITGIVTAEAGR